jgi:hypothetical protein
MEHEGFLVEPGSFVLVHAVVTLYESASEQENKGISVLEGASAR